MVAERSVNRLRLIEIFVEEIRSENVDMSNDKQCKNTVALSSRFSVKG